MLGGKSSIDPEDLAQCGIMRILAAVRAGITGTDWYLLQRASWAMRKAMNRELHRTAAEAFSLDDPESGVYAEPTIQPMDPQELPSWHDLMSHLTTRERRVLAAIHKTCLTQKETAKKLGVSQPRVHQLYRQSLDKLRQVLTKGAASRPPKTRKPANRARSAASGSHCATRHGRSTAA
jgi:RNA polymerase sigma factor (sigma-70 family)